ncbi:hypothetical protein EQG49_06375 [Periweissella cryptocerci]|uniref:Uncharacterized protein n=1 Tax=Periweissella cryptocerci TaxID=2506420 RepID=A0A4P6YTM5_9LACO|nr:hypothetical protein [Periweissella cryptocerci]QBO36108.1 hypothetical protein EQG49_06375 [Periweissella cryptocerci]
MKNADENGLREASTALNLVAELEDKVLMRDGIFDEQEKSDQSVLNTLVIVCAIVIGLLATFMTHRAISSNHELVSAANELKVLAIVLLGGTVVAYLALRFIFHSVVKFFMYVFARPASKTRIRGILNLQNEIGTRVNQIDDEYSDIPNDVLSSSLMSQVKVYLKRQDALDLEEAIFFTQSGKEKNKLYYEEINSMVQREKNLMQTLDFDSETEEEKGIRILELLRKNE